MRKHRNPAVRPLGRRHTLVAFEDDNGTLGWIWKGSPTDNRMYAATDGRLLAHDLIEHMHGVKHIGSASDEAIALGAVWYVRGQHADLSRPNYGFFSPENSIASDFIGSVFNEWFYDQQSADVHVRTTAERRTKHDMCPDSLQCILDYIKEDLPKEHDDHIDPATMRAYLKFCRDGLRMGYRAAAHRYRNINANTLFWMVAEKLNGLRAPEFEGETAQVRIDWDEYNYPDVRAWKLYD
jgi:hypothetical protein